MLSNSISIVDLKEKKKKLKNYRWIWTKVERIAGPFSKLG
jgi:hypothetical protein